MIMRKLVAWTPKEASILYWLILWGLDHKSTYELATPLIPTRSPDAVRTMSSDIRRRLTDMKGLPIGADIHESLKRLVREASKIEPIQEIASLKPENLNDVKFIPINIKARLKKKHVKTPVNFEQKADDELNSLVRPKPEALAERMYKIKQKEFPNETKNPQESPQSLLGMTSESKVVVGKDLVTDFGSGYASQGSDFDVDKMMNKLAETPFQLVNKEPSFEEVLKYAKEAGATKVCYKDYIIKFV